MDKLKYIKLKNEDGTYTNAIPLAVDADHVDIGGDTLTSKLNTLATKTEVAAVASGAPKPVSSVSEMTDTTKIYVLTTDGNWYYYNGTNWVAGGVYQATELSDGEVEINNLSDNLFNIFDFEKINSNTQFNWEQGIIDANGRPGTDTSHAYWNITIRTANFLNVDNFNLYKKLTNFLVYIFFYSDTQTYLGRIETIADYDVNSVFADIKSQFPTAKYYKVTIRRRLSLGSTYTPEDYLPEHFVIYGANSFDDTPIIPDTDEYVKETDDTMISLPSLSFGTNSYGSGQTLVKDYLVSFGISNDEHTNYKELHIFKINKTNKTYELVKTMTHNFGHVNSVDYCEKTDCLIFGNGSGAYNRNGSFYIYKNFSSVLEDDTATQLEISNAMEYDCSQTPFYTEDKWNVIWFDSNRNNYDLALLVTNDLRKFRVLQLAKGNYQFTYGTMISSPGADEFNGTFRVVDEYTFDTGTTEQVTDWVIQDMDYQSGKLYCGVSHNYPYYWVFTFDRLNHVINREIIPIYSYYLDGTDALKGAAAICCNDEFVIINTGLIIFKPRV